jgi:hypothetical protein
MEEVVPKEDLEYLAMSDGDNGVFLESAVSRPRDNMQGSVIHFVGFGVILLL